MPPQINQNQKKKKPPKQIEICVRKLSGTVIYVKYTDDKKY